VLTPYVTARLFEGMRHAFAEKIHLYFVAIKLSSIVAFPRNEFSQHCGA
jgi:hypothetical protein